MTVNNKLVNHNYSRRSIPEGGFRSFTDFYAFYLGEHCNLTNRRMHVIGTTFSIIIGLLALYKQQPKLALLGLIQAYTLAWIGHFVFEKNKPATFKFPLWSFACDVRMWYEIVSAKRAF
ncbi:membrane protein [Pilobolus umbonatus]|nr:membrane protein [Pilobolus umbonatus]